MHNRLVVVFVDGGGYGSTGPVLWSISLAEYIKRCENFHTRACASCWPLGCCVRDVGRDMVVDAVGGGLVILIENGGSLVSRDVAMLCGCRS